MIPKKNFQNTYKSHLFQFAIEYLLTLKSPKAQKNKKSTESKIVYNNLFEGLVTLDQAGKVQPLLAKKWKISKDKKTYIFELQKNVFFHDGKKFTADDVVFSLNRIIAKKSVNAQKLSISL